MTSRGRIYFRSLNGFYDVIVSRFEIGVRAAVVVVFVVVVVVVVVVAAACLLFGTRNRR